jgi:putative hydrolase of the HAD superfamily
VERKEGCILFDWGNTLMKVFPEFSGPMVDWPEVEAIPHARDVLIDLRDKWVIAMATNAADSDEAAIRAALARVDLDEQIDRVYCSKAIGHKKPSAEFFEAVLRDLGMGRSAVFMVGDDFEADVAGANRSGLRAVWLCPGSGEIRETAMHRTIRNLRELPRAIEDLRKGEGQ